MVVPYCIAYASQEKQLNNNHKFICNTMNCHILQDYVFWLCIIFFFFHLRSYVNLRSKVFDLKSVENDISVFFPL